MVKITTQKDKVVPGATQNLLSLNYHNTNALIDKMYSTSITGSNNFQTQDASFAPLFLCGASQCGGADKCGP